MTEKFIHTIDFDLHCSSPDQQKTTPHLQSPPPSVVLHEKPMDELISINQLLDTNVPHALSTQKPGTLIHLLPSLQKETQAVEQDQNKDDNPRIKPPAPYLEFLQCKKQLTPPEETPGGSMFPVTMRDLRNRPTLPRPKPSRVEGKKSKMNRIVELGCALLIIILSINTNAISPHC